MALPGPHEVTRLEAASFVSPRVGFAATKKLLPAIPVDAEAFSSEILPTRQPAESFSLLVTLDGRQSWQPVQDASQGRPWSELRAQFDHRSGLVGLHFTSRNAGFAALVKEGQLGWNADVMETTDGGRTWRLVRDKARAARVRWRAANLFQARFRHYGPGTRW